MILSSGDKKRLRYFNEYSENLDAVLKEHNCKLARYGTGGEVSFYEGKNFICPLCFQIYQEADCIKQPGAEPNLTLEHNPPKITGGSISTLTCRTCNNFNGGHLDAQIENFVLGKGFLNMQPGYQIPVKYTIHGDKIAGTIELEKEKTFVMLPHKKSNPRGYAAIFERLRNGVITEFNLSFTVPTEQRVHKSYLRIAHLIAFNYFGYAYLLNNSGCQVAAAIRDEIEYPIPGYGVSSLIVPATGISIYAIQKPVDLRNLLVSFPINIKSTAGVIEKKVTIILPGPDQQGWQRLQNIAIQGKDMQKYSADDMKLDWLKSKWNSYYEVFTD